jgi:WD40 repeat protein/predicted Ser/Thr protein kinase
LSFVQVLRRGEVVETLAVDVVEPSERISVYLQTCGQVEMRPSETTQIGDYLVRIVPYCDGHGPSLAMDQHADFPPISVDAAGEVAIPLQDAPPTLEDYRLIERVGEGGMGVVWRAVQLSTKRQVAVKFMRGSLFGSGHAQKRFQREVEFLSSLEHANIARLYHAGIRGGVSYFVMEYVEGVHLDRYVNQQQLTQRVMLDLFARICRAVQYAHQKGVIHRDLKPSNMLVRPSGEPCLMDFGLATRSFDHPQHSLSIDGAILGTLDYMSPEQAAGDNDSVSTRSDIYSLGVILYELVTGHPPFRSNLTRFEKQRQIIEEEPVRPKSVSRHISRDLEAIILKAVAKLPAARYTSAEAMADDISKYLAGDPVQAHALTLPYLIRKQALKHKAAVALILAVTLTLLITFGWSYHRVAQEREVAVASEKERSQALYASRIQAAQSLLAQGEHVRALDVLQKCPAELRRWEWSYLRSQADQSIATLKADATIRAIAFVAETGSILAIDRRGNLYEWDATSHNLLRVTKLGVEPSYRASLSADGRRFALTAGDQVWVGSVGDPSKLTTLRSPDDAPVTLALDSAGDTLAVSYNSNTIRVWDLNSGALRDEFGVDNACKQLLVDTKGIVYAVDGTIFIRNFDTTLRTIELEGAGSEAVLALAVDPTGEMVAVADNGIGISIWRRDGTLLARRESGAAVYCIGFDALQCELFYADSGGVLHRWDYTLDKSVGTYRGHGAGVHSITAGADGTRFLTGSDDELKLWNSRQAADIQQTYPVMSAFGATLVKIDPSSRYVAASSGWNDGLLIDISENNRLVWTPIDLVDSAWLARDGESHLVWLERSGEIKWLDPGTGEISGNTVVGLNPIQTATIVPGHNYVIFTAERRPNELVIADLKTGKILNVIPAAMPAIAHEASGRLWAIDPAKPGRINEWDMVTWTMKRSWQASDDDIAAHCVSEDGGRLAVHCRRGEVGVWDLTSLSRVTTITPEEVLGFSKLVLNYDGTRLFAGGRVLRIWAMGTTDELIDLRSLGITSVTDLALGPDHRTLVVGHAAGLTVFKPHPLNQPSN